jgi:hypothetical protein
MRLLAGAVLVAGHPLHRNDFPDANLGVESNKHRNENGAVHRSTGNE